MAKAQTDIRTTSYDANTANAVGYQGSLDDALAQIRQELDIAAPNKARAELLHYLGVDRDIREMSGEQVDNDLAVYLRRANLFTSPADDSVEYGAPSDDLLALQAEWERGDKSMTWVDFKRKEPKRAPSPYSLEYAIEHGFVTRVQS